MQTHSYITALAEGLWHVCLLETGSSPTYWVLRQSHLDSCPRSVQLVVFPFEFIYLLIKWWLITALLPDIFGTCQSVKTTVVCNVSSYSKTQSCLPGWDVQELSLHWTLALHWSLCQAHHFFVSFNPPTLQVINTLCFIMSPMEKQTSGLVKGSNLPEVMRFWSCGWGWDLGLTPNPRSHHHHTKQE